MLQVSKAVTDGFSGPTVEKGLAALDSLYELRNVIPGLITTSDLGDQEGELLLTIPPQLDTD